MQEKMSYVIKRFVDFFCSMIGLVVLSPIFLAISVAIKVDSKGPIIFAQERRTKDGKIFKMYKFRSMCVDAEKKGAGLFNYKNDPRVTKVGRFLRDTSLDELPQLINIVRGDLSLVGPRPCVTYELGDFDTLNKKYKKRFEVTAGLTGLAQVKGRNENSWDEKVTYDNLYIDMFKEQGVWIDIKILFWTVLKVFEKRDIYEEKADDMLDDVTSAKLQEEEIIRIAHLQDEE